MAAGLMKTDEAADRVLKDFLDDPNARRWSNLANGDVMRALRSALDKCMLEYHQGGGQKWLVVDERTTDANGQVTLNSIINTLPARILWVVWVEGEFRQELEPVAYKDVQYFEQQSGVTLEVCHSAHKRLDVSFAPTNLIDLVSNHGSEEEGFPQFEEWVCARAAAELAVKDVARYPAVKMLEQEARALVMGSQPTFTNQGFPSETQDSVYAYTWNGQKIQLVRRV